jgi:hypothetical protein
MTILTINLVLVSVYLIVKSGVKFFYAGSRTWFAFLWMPLLVFIGWFLAESHVGHGQGLVVGTILLFAILTTYIIETTNYGG